MTSTSQARHPPAPAPGRSAVGTRLLSAAVLLPPLLVLLFLGGWAWLALCSAASAWATYEYVRLALERPWPERLIAVAMAAGLPVLAVLAPSLLVGLPVALLMVLWTAQVLLPATGGPERVAHALAAVTFCGGGLACIAVLRERPDGFTWTAVTLALTWTNDAAAYFAGRSLGRRPLAPKVSPHKTWEGAVGGAVGALLLAGGIALARPALGAKVLVLAIACSVAGPLGDLSKSVLKRARGVKDSGTLIPGHGGLLDRIDALLFNAPVALALLRWW